jgi:beta-phosphoglucomutase
MYKGIIFDLDGVIVSTDKYHYEAWKKMALKEDIYFDEIINNRLRGVSRKESLDIILERSNKTYSTDEKEKLMKYKNDLYVKNLESLSKDDILPNVFNLLIKLKENNILLGIGSSSKNTKLILKKIGLLEFFDFISDGTMITRSKPFPDVFILCAEGLSLRYSECLVVEDAISGIEAANAGGFFSFAISDAKKCELATYKSDDIRDILKLV